MEAIVTDPAEAISIFEEIVRAHSTNVIARKQLGSLYIGAGRTEDALEQFRVVDILSPSDTTKLQIAYLLATLVRNGEAQLAFDDGAPDLMTEKDAVKCRGFAGSSHWSLEVGARFSEADAQRLLAIVDEACRRRATAS